MSEEEYEVEDITEARCVKRARKVIMEYRVKWKDYDSDKNTWEPVTSFSGSGELLANFWARVELGGRDYKNMTQFKVGETFTPVGPPQSQRTTKPDTAVSPSPSVGPSKSTRTSKRRRSYSPAYDLEEKPSKRTRGRAESARRPADGHQTPRERPPARSIRQTKKRTLSPQIVPTSEDDEDNDSDISVDPVQSPSIDQAPHMQDAVRQSLEDDVRIQVRDDTPIQIEQPQESASPPKNLRSHRARAAQPLVKMADDPSPLNGAISVKARLHTRIALSDEAPSAGTSNSPPRKSRKPGPGRSSAGMLKKKPKNTSSLLTFEKGALKTVKGQFTIPLDERDDETEPSTSNLPLSVADLPVPPTSDELLQLGGFDAKDAEALDDFEDDEVSAPAEPRNNDLNAIQQSLTLAKNKLFPPGTSMATSFSNTVTSVWRRATIFGPLGLGSDVAPQTLSESKLFLLKLDTTVNVPLNLLNASQSLDTLICENPNASPPGKFFAHSNALKLLDTVRTGGPAARAEISDSATEEQKIHFMRFRSRLDQGDLFTAMVGPVFIVFCSSETLLHRLNLPSALLSFSNSLFVTQLTIDNHTAYMEVADAADTSRW